MASSPNTTKRTPDDGNWIHGCFVVKVGTDFKSYKAILEYTLQDETYQGGTKTKPVLDPAVKKLLADASTEGYSKYTPLPVYYAKRKCRDSSLGGNDAINPLPQFSLDDDIAHPMYIDKIGTTGMGQVYSENYDDLQQVLYLGFGIPVFSNVGGFWANATDIEFSKFVNQGSGITKEKIGYLLGSAPIRIVQMTTIPFRFIGAMIDSLQNVPISKYYSFSSQMPMYFRFVNTILVMLATNMNIMGSSEEIPSTGSKTSGDGAIKQLDGFYTDKSNTDMSGISSVFRESGLDMARIMLKRFYYENGDRKLYSNRWTDTTIFEYFSKNGDKGVNEEADKAQDTSTSPQASQSGGGGAPDGEVSLRKYTLGWFDNFAASWTDAIYDGHLFIGFRIDKGMGGSESFSNSTGESQISQVANAKLQAGREAALQGGAGGGDDWVSTILDKVIGFAQGAIEGVGNTLSLDALAGAATGAARVDIPDVWISSSYSRSQSFTITCMSPYGDFESIFQSEYVPFACILAGALPRGTGMSSHSAPFVCQAYCRGVFASPLCMIESLEVTRGSDQFGMNMARLPLKLTMNVTLKDLTPVMYMSMGGDRGLMNAIFGTDDNFGEYMMTLAGMGLRDRISPYRAIRRRTKILLSTIFKNKLSPYMNGMDFGANTFVSRMISAIVGPGRNLPGN